MKFNELIKIDANFQNSINIGLDLSDDAKVNAFIPTTTGIDFLSHFLSNVENDDGDHSSMIIAPYGKGKSHSVLTLLALLKNTDYKKYNKLLSKISIASNDLYKQIIRLENKKYFPIIISNTRGTLNQALLYSLQKSLNNEGINNLTVDNDFIQVINRIEEWKKNYPDTYVSFENELKANKISIEKFTNAIRTYNESAYNMFKRIHKNILSGAEFVSQNSLEVVDYYQKIANQLISNYKYDGVYIVFDEFSKFLESRDEKTISNDMKIIQDLSELCNNSKTENIYLQLIMHKPINDYISVDKRVRNAFKGIEGRVNAYYFVSSLKNSFDLVSNVITKTKKYSQEKKKLKDYSEEVYKKMSQLPPFYSNFTQEYLEKEMFDACFPLHPLTVYLLIKINEKVAQNERTLFTFLSKDTQNSLPFRVNHFFSGIYG